MSSVCAVSRVYDCHVTGIARAAQVVGLASSEWGLANMVWAAVVIGKVCRWVYGEIISDIRPATEW